MLLFVSVLCEFRKNRLPGGVAFKGLPAPSSKELRQAPGRGRRRPEAPGPQLEAARRATPGSSALEPPVRRAPRGPTSLQPSRSPKKRRGGSELLGAARLLLLGCFLELLGGFCSAAFRSCSAASWSCSAAAWSCTPPRGPQPWAEELRAPSAERQAAPRSAEPPREAPSAKALRARRSERRAPRRSRLRPEAPEVLGPSSTPPAPQAFAWGPRPPPPRGQAS